MTLKMTSAQVVETSFIVNNNSSFQNYTNPDDHTQQTTDTPGFKPFTVPFTVKFDLFMNFFFRFFIEDQVHCNLMFESHHLYNICAAACPVCQIFDVI